MHGLKGAILAIFQFWQPKHFCCRRENLFIHIFAQIKSYDADHDNNYEPNLNCQWLVVGEPGKVIKLTFTTFNIEQDQNNTHG